MRVFTVALFFSILLTPVAHSDDRQECRQKTKVSEVANCIERGIYDPCDDAGSAWGRGMCASAHIEVAERRITKAKSDLLKRFEEWKLSDSKRKDFITAQEKWREYREKYCSASDALAVYFIDHSQEAIFAMDTNYSFCVRRLSEQHAAELEFTLSKTR